MNNTFSIKRFLRLLAYENRSSHFLRNIAIFAAIFTPSYIILYKLGLLYFGQVRATPFADLIIVLLIYLSPIIFYHPLLKENKRLLHSMLPASNLEKYLSLLVNTSVIAPLIITGICSLCNKVVWFMAGYNNIVTNGLLANTSYVNTVFIISIVTFIYITHLSKGGYITAGIILLLPFIVDYTRRITKIAIPVVPNEVVTIFYILVLHLFIYIGLKNISNKLSL